MHVNQLARLYPDRLYSGVSWMSRCRCSKSTRYCLVCFNLESPYKLPKLHPMTRPSVNRDLGVCRAVPMHSRVPTDSRITNSAGDRYFGLPKRVLLLHRATGCRHILLFSSLLTSACTNTNMLAKSEPSQVVGPGMIHKMERQTSVFTRYSTPS